MTLPEFRHALANIIDLVDAALPPGKELGDEMADHVDQAATELANHLCSVFGHEPVQDQCRLPEHDYCILCKAITPGQAKRKTT